ncbi:hypothetical protein MIDIC_330031 [Alphaproteobacteria bacterium]
MLHIYGVSMDELSQNTVQCTCITGETWNDFLNVVLHHTHSDADDSCILDHTTNNDSTNSSQLFDHYNLILPIIAQFELPSQILDNSLLAKLPQCWQQNNERLENTCILAIHTNSSTSINKILGSPTNPLQQSYLEIISNAVSSCFRIGFNTFDQINDFFKQYDPLPNLLLQGVNAQRGAALPNIDYGGYGGGANLYGGGMPNYGANYGYGGNFGGGIPVNDNFARPMFAANNNNFAVGGGYNAAPYTNNLGLGNNLGLNDNPGLYTGPMTTPLYNTPSWETPKSDPFKINTIADPYNLNSFEKSDPYKFASDSRIFKTEPPQYELHNSWDKPDAYGVHNSWDKYEVRSVLDRPDSYGVRSVLGKNDPDPLGFDPLSPYHTKAFADPLFDPSKEAPYRKPLLDNPAERYDPFNLNSNPNPIYRDRDPMKVEFKPAEIKISNIELIRPNPADFSSHIKIDLPHPEYYFPHVEPQKKPDDVKEQPVKTQPVKPEPQYNPFASDHEPKLKPEPNPEKKCDPNPHEHGPFAPKMKTDGDAEEKASDAKNDDGAKDVKNEKKDDHKGAKDGAKKDAKDSTKQSDSTGISGDDSKGGKDEVFKHALKDIVDLKLSEHEGGDWDGHTIKQHTEKDKEEFLKKMADYKAKHGTDLEQASSYPDVTTAEVVTKEVIKKNVKEIEEWWKKAYPYSKQEFKATFDKEIGYGLRKGADKLEPKTKAQVVLKKMADGSIKIISSYPID